MTGRRIHRRRMIGGGGAVGLALVALLVLQGQAISDEQSQVQASIDATVAIADDGEDDVTYAKHVAPILQEKCQICHQPNSVAPYL